MLAVWSLVPLPFLKLAWTRGSSQFTYCWSLAWSILSITLLACEMSAIVRKFEHSLASPFFGIGMKTDLFQSCGHCWVFQICWHIECNTLIASAFRTWNSSTGIPSPPLALFVVMLPAAHLTSHSRMGPNLVSLFNLRSGRWLLLAFPQLISNHHGGWQHLFDHNLGSPHSCSEAEISEYFDISVYWYGRRYFHSQ